MKGDFFFDVNSFDVMLGKKAFCSRDLLLNPEAVFLNILGELLPSFLLFISLNFYFTEEFKFT